MAKRNIQQEKEEKLSLQEIKEIITVIKRNGISEFDLEQSGMHLRILTSKDSPESVASGNQPVVIHQMPAPMYSPAPAYAPMPAAPIQEAYRPAEEPAAAKPAPQPAEEDLSKYTEIKSPMVGTFYRAPAPDAPPYVEVGDYVTTNSVLCIVEAMKLMNELKSEAAGKIKKICVENGHPVEYGQTLFLVEPN